jgi:hypothetical protein
MIDLGPNDIWREPNTDIPVEDCPWGCGDRHPADEIWDCQLAPIEPRP